MTLEKFVNITWYLQRKPYSAHDEYDLFYLGICRDLYVRVKKVAANCANDIVLDDEEFRELAYAFTAYFEDRVNQIGFWESLITQHLKLFGKRLPFFDASRLKEEEERCDDILPADIHYLAFITYLQLSNDEDYRCVAYLNSSFLVTLAAEVFNYLNDIDEIVTTDFYESYLVPPDDYIDFKRVQEWFTFNSYFTSISFRKKLNNIESSVLGPDIDPTMSGPMIYARKDVLLFEVPSIYTALFPVDILAGAMRCSETTKRMIADLKWRPHGIYELRGESPTHVVFVHSSTGETFDVLKKSFKGNLDGKKTKFWMTTLAPWMDGYYVSGMCLASTFDEDERLYYNINNQSEFQRHFQPYRERLKETAFQFRQKAVEFFKNDLTAFDTGDELQEEMEKFSQWYFDTVTDKTMLDEGISPAAFALPEELIEARDVALFFPPCDNMEYLIGHSELLELLQSDPDNISPHEVEKAIPLLLDEYVSADYWFYLRNNFSLAGLSHFLKCPAETNEDFEAALRIYKPAEFSPLKLPRFTTFNSAEIKSDGVKERLGIKLKDSRV